MESAIHLEFLLALLMQAPAAVLLPGTLLLLLEIAGAGARRRADTVPATPAPPFTVLVCAHDEELVIGATLAALIPQLRPGADAGADTRDRLLVVADNCTDRTAAIARTCGADVTERHDPARRGKGYALEHGLAVAARWSPAVVVIIDADCTVAPGGLAALAAQAVASGRPAQARYEMIAPPGAGTGPRFREFAVRIKNDLRLRGGARLGVPCLLTGSGMALAPSMFEGVTVGSGERVEDMVLGIDLARVGLPPRFCPGALVTSPLPIAAAAVDSQRRRWEGGVITVALRRAGPLLGEALRRRDPGLALLAIDITIPPLSLLAMLLLAGLGLGAVGVALGLPAWIMALPLAETVVVAVAVALAWRARGRDLLGLADVGPFLARFAHKALFYLTLARHRREGWVRTGRDTLPPAGD